MKSNIKLNLQLAMGITLLTACSQTKNMGEEPSKHSAEDHQILKEFDQLGIQDKQEGNNFPGFNRGFILKSEKKQKKIEQEGELAKQNISEKQLLNRRLIISIEDVKKAYSDLLRNERDNRKKDAPIIEFVPGSNYISDKVAVVQNFSFLLDKTAVMFHNFFELFAIDSSEIVKKLNEAARLAKESSKCVKQADQEYMEGCRAVMPGDLSQQLIAINALSDKMNKRWVAIAAINKNMWNLFIDAWTKIAASRIDKNLSDQALIISQSAANLRAEAQAVYEPNKVLINHMAVFRSLNLDWVDKDYKNIIKSIEKLVKELTSSNLTYIPNKI